VRGSVLRVAAMALLAMVSAAAGAQQAFAVVGGYGFDWTRPKAARCTAITAAGAARFKPCTFAPSGAFGLDLAYHSCPLQRGGEMIVLASMAACNEALETMRANAP
jgi:hypothetical protein